MNVLLDTVAFLWWVTDDPALSDQATELIRDPSRRVFLSPVSVWEIVVKHALGKMPLPEDPTTLVPRLRSDHGFQELQLTEGAVLQLQRLPALHRDPFGRMLLCQAIEHGLILVTPDEELRRYPVRTAW
ncbi:MAG: type II toxin-antitoxin system VapC family toxin [Gemmatimonadota bacterium]